MTPLETEADPNIRVGPLRWGRPEFPVDCLRADAIAKLVMVPVAYPLFFKGLFLAHGLDESTNIGSVHAHSLPGEATDAKPTLDLCEVIDCLARQLVQFGDDISTSGSFNCLPTVMISIGWSDTFGFQKAV